MKYKKLEYKNKGRIYDFEYYSLNDIEDKYGLKKKYRVGKFLSLLYKKRIRNRGIEYGDLLIIRGYVYVSWVELEGVLGSYYWKDLLSGLEEDGIIEVDRDKSNRFDSNKKLWFIKINDGFIDCKKTIVDIESGVLNRYLDNQSVKVKNRFEKRYKKDDLLIWEKVCVMFSTLKIENLDEVIELRFSNKFKENIEKLNWNWLSKNERNKIENNFKDVDNWKSKYKNDLRNYYEVLNEDLHNLKENNWLDFSDGRFKRDGYGKRLYHLYSNTIREFRDYIKIDDEETIELDIKSCFLSLFFVLIKDLNSDVENKFIKDIKSKLLKESNLEWSEISGLDFIDKFSSIFNNEGVFWSEKNEIEFNDYYDLMRLSYGENHYNDMSRNSYKELVFRLLFSKEYELQNLKIENETIDDIELRFFGNNGKKLMFWLRRIYLYNWISNDEGGRNKIHKRSNNISLILHYLENSVMDILRYELKKNRFKYISVFDSLIVKKSDSKNILKIGNSVLKGIDESLLLRRKYKDGWKGI